MSERKLTLLERAGLHRPELRAWAMYDWANSAFILIVITAVFPIYYQTTAAADLKPETATVYYTRATTGALTLVALMAPVLGALADFLGRRKQLMALFVGLGVVTTAGLFLVHRGDWPLALLLFAIANVGVSTSFVFYDALLPHVARGDELDRVSTAGYALGYLGSAMLLILNLAWILKPEAFGLPDAGFATRLAFLSVAVWWALFSLPLFRKVSEPPRQIERDETAASALRATFSRLFETFGELRGSYKEAFKMLLAVLIYNDGIGTMIRVAALYAATRNLPQTDVITAIILVQLVGIPFAFLFGNLAVKISAKRAILLALVVYVGICFLAYGLDTTREFYVLAILVGMVQGGAQALSRSLFASMIPKHKSSEFFGFFSVFEKFAGIFGPLIFGEIVNLTGSSQQAILAIIVFFVAGGALLMTVDVEAGQRQARLADEQLVATHDRTMQI